MKSLVCWVCFLFGPCTWEPGQGAPGCRGGLRPFLLCSCSCLVFKRLPQEWSYLSFHLFTCTMGFAPIKWTCTALFRPRQLTDRAILANRQPQEKKSLPNGQYGPVSQLSRSEKCCTGPFNWGEAHCAGEKVKRKIGPFLRKSLWTKQEQQHNKGAQPATATRNPPARLPGARAENNNQSKQETSKTNPGTP